MAGSLSKNKFMSLCIHCKIRPRRKSGKECLECHRERTRAWREAQRGKKKVRRDQYIERQEVYARKFGSAVLQDVWRGIPAVAFGAIGADCGEGDEAEVLEGGVGGDAQ